MKYLYRILRLFFVPKCKHHWKTISKDDTKVSDGGAHPIAILVIIEQECVHCGINEIKVTRIAS